jgi:PKD domain
VISLFVLATLGGAQAASASSNLTYYGGPVAHSMNVVLVDWGSGVRSSYTDTASGDPAFFSYLASQSGTTSDLGGVLAQYMDTSGQNSANRISYSGAVQITPSSSGTTVYDSDIQSELTDEVNAATLPAPVGDGLSTMYVVLFPPGDIVCQGSRSQPGYCSSDTRYGFCAYHGSFPLNSSSHVLYAAMVDNGFGSPNYGQCGPSSNDLSNQTDVLSHEFAETINDPLVAEANSLAWYDFNPNQGEIADKCVGSSEQTLNGAWTVQKIWSNLDGNCVASEAAFAAPAVGFTPPSGGSSGQLLSFDGTGSSDAGSDQTSVSFDGSNYAIGPGIASYDWNWGDGSPDGSGASATHAYAANQIYNVTLTVTNDLGFTGAVTRQVRVGVPAPAVTTGSADGISWQGATLHGSINPGGESLSYQFVYGPSPSQLYMSTSATPVPTGTSATPVSATVSGLGSGTTYYYQLRAFGGGGTFVGAVQSLTTDATASASPATQTPIPGTGAATHLGTGGAVLNGTVNPGGAAGVTYRFLYGSSASKLYHSTAESSLPAGTTAVPVHASIGALKTHARYYYRLDVGLNGNTYAGSTLSFTTKAPAPGAKTGAAVVHGTAVTLHGTVNSRGFFTRYHFELGRTKRYGRGSSSASAARTGSRPITLSLAGLRPHTLYHYRLVALSVGGTTTGVDRTFRTGGGPSHAPRFSLDVARGQRLGPVLALGLRVTVTCSTACRASSSAVPALPGISADDAFPITLASGSRTLRHAGAASLTLRFSAAVRRRLRGSRSITLIVIGTGSAHGSLSAPRTAAVRLAR